MENLVLTRIDDRLIHGQVMTAWIKNKNAEQVVIIDDGVAQDDFMINVLENAVPDNIAIGIFSKEDGVTFFSDPLEAPTIILAKTPQVLEYMIDHGINIQEIDLGGMGAKDDRERLYHTISTNKEENESFKRLMDKGVDAFIQIMPQNDKVSLKTLLK
ncbi:PTS system mannose/fructose/N-acetylgalactosamine-transporter subunit IIB [Latilactobacillus curvatus]|uniref:PTS system mannose/fructose/N-acetylgalactosamine-transporter subunit IIB n=1 Tax=Latilactobacillus curvatus TaxID=28038 RepID=UPI000A1B3FA5|nr:PTS sugar transporter subunit IIB [Latilactobacillus curvatus]AZP95675.1 PTS mannose/fructose/sorbose transporter subunit IIB [Latilactobacillus curvatus]MBZ1505225.1 PTS sugar transporter subunit IIB [Latilactobacillus curvatus]MCT3532903.1 PTS mannose/fructose/sorbose transporter subunit IIB [Latilactobacillus curvatus]MED9787168.1 PTS sugar transporter subunit IIB [Latilactobacillus curvatus]UTC08213.1 PTS mannose transporter subunit IID [Latilactobacillus curvatus]